jgi:hypothetical protein
MSAMISWAKLLGELVPSSRNGTALPTGSLVGGTVPQHPGPLGHQENLIPDE